LVAVLFLGGSSLAKGTRGSEIRPGHPQWPIRKPADPMLQQFLDVWAVKHGRPYDVLEVPPKQDDAETLRRDFEHE
jgi:hypothetical protein